MSEDYEVVLRYGNEATAKRAAAKVNGVELSSARIRKVNPDARPVADPEE